MTSAPGATARLARLVREIDVDVAALDARAGEIRSLLNGWSTGPSSTTLVVAAVNVHGWYTALETLLERVARLLDESVPSGPAWHVDLISQMTVDVPGLRPAVLEPGIALDLGEIRKFRHFFRNAYVLDFDPARVREQAEILMRVHPPVRAGLDGLRRHVDQVIRELAER